MKSIGIIGMGNMGFAIAGGLSGKLKDVSIRVIDKDADLAEKRAQAIGAGASRSYEELMVSSDVIIIAVKPQHLESLFAEIRPYSKGKKIITIAAGKKISYFTGNLETDQVIRFMPNIAAKENESLTAVSFSTETSDEFKKEAVIIAESFGKSLILSEDLMPAFTGLCGSGIAYVFAFIHAMALGGTSSGIPYGTSLDVAVSTIEGALALLKAEKSNPVTNLTKVISAGGTTIAGIKSLEKHAFTAAVMEAVESASSRAKDFEN